MTHGRLRLALAALLVLAPARAAAFVVHPCPVGNGVKLVGPPVVSIWAGGANGPLTAAESADVDAAIASYNSNRLNRSLVRWPVSLGAQIHVYFAPPPVVDVMCLQKVAACTFNFGSCASGIVSPTVWIKDDTGGMLPVQNQENPGFLPQIAPATDPDDVGQARVAVLLHEIGHAFGLGHAVEAPGLMNAPDAPVNQALNDEMKAGKNYLPDDLAGLKLLYGTKGNPDAGLTWFAAVPAPVARVKGFGSFQLPCSFFRCVKWNSVPQGNFPLVSAGSIYKNAPWPALGLGGSQSSWSGSLSAHLVSADGKLQYAVYTGPPRTLSGAYYAQPDGTVGATGVDLAIPAGAPEGWYSLVYDLSPSGPDQWPGNNHLSTGPIIYVM